MNTENQINRKIFFITTMEEIVPKDSYFRKINKYIDFSFIDKETKYLYNKLDKKPNIEPVIFFKLVIIKVLEEIETMRKICEKINVNAEYRWFLQIPFGYEIPNFSDFKKMYNIIYKDKFKNILIYIIKQLNNHNLIDDLIINTLAINDEAINNIVNLEINKIEKELELK